MALVKKKPTMAKEASYMSGKKPAHIREGVAVVEEHGLPRLAQVKASCTSG